MYIYSAPTNGNPLLRRVCSTFICQFTYARLNKKVFSLALNSVRDNSLSRISLVSSFQSFGPATAKLLVPDVDTFCSWSQVTTTSVCRDRLTVSFQIWGSCVVKAFLTILCTQLLNCSYWMSSCMIWRRVSLIRRELPLDATEKVTSAWLCLGSCPSRR